MKYLIIILLLVTSCDQSEDWRKSPDCYKLDNLDTYLPLDQFSTKNEAIWYVTYDDADGNNEQVEIACSMRDAYIWIYNYNCDNYPKEFIEFSNVLISYGVPCN